MSNREGRRFQGENLTQRCVDAAAPGASEYTLSDHRTDLCLRVRPSGAKAYVVFYRHRGKAKRWTIGKPSALTLEQARTEARLITAAIARGDDPAAAKAQRRGATLETVFWDYERLSLSQKRLSYQRWTRRLFKAEIIPKLGKAPMVTVVRSEIRDLTNAITGRGAPIVANNVHRAFSAFLTWCVHEGILAVNPIYGVPQPNRPKQRTRTLVLRRAEN